MSDAETEVDAGEEEFTLVKLVLLRHPGGDIVRGEVASAGNETALTPLRTTRTRGLEWAIGSSKPGFQYGPQQF
ncbi:MAG: hypothetical protein ACRDTX_29830 [Pseudonocardiaceae bacterium]